MLFSWKTPQEDSGRHKWRAILSIWQAILCCLLPGSKHQGYLFPLLHKLCSHCKQTGCGTELSQDHLLLAMRSCFVPYHCVFLVQPSKQNQVKEKKLPRLCVHSGHTPYFLPPSRAAKIHTFLAIDGYFCPDAGTSASVTRKCLEVWASRHMSMAQKISSESWNSSVFWQFCLGLDGQPMAANHCLKCDNEKKKQSLSE